MLAATRPRTANTTTAARPQRVSPARAARYLAGLSDRRAAIRAGTASCAWDAPFLSLRGGLCRGRRFVLQRTVVLDHRRHSVTRSTKEERRLSGIGARPFEHVCATGFTRRRETELNAANNPGGVREDLDAQLAQWHRLADEVVEARRIVGPEPQCREEIVDRDEHRTGLVGEAALTGHAAASTVPNR